MIRCDAVDACTTVLAWIDRAFVDVDLAEVPVKPQFTFAGERIDLVRAEPAVLAGVRIAFVRVDVAIFALKPLGAGAHIGCHTVFAGALVEARVRRAIIDVCAFDAVALVPLIACARGIDGPVVGARRVNRAAVESFVGTHIVVGEDDGLGGDGLRLCLSVADDDFTMDVVTGLESRKFYARLCVDDGVCSGQVEHLSVGCFDGV